MMNAVFAAMCCAGLVWGLFSGRAAQMGQAALQATAAGASVEQTNNAMLLDGAINGASFHRNSTIEETIESLESNWELVLFWIGWVLLTGGAVVGFYYIDNRWLEDK